MVITAVLTRTAAVEGAVTVVKSAAFPTASVVVPEMFAGSVTMPLPSWSVGRMVYSNVSTLVPAPLTYSALRGVPPMFSGSIGVPATSTLSSKLTAKDST